MDTPSSGYVCDNRGNLNPPLVLPQKETSLLHPPNCDIIQIENKPSYKGGKNVLTQMLQQGKSLTDLPLPDQQIIMKLARKFQSQHDYLFLEPEKLVELTNLGTADQWQQLLLLPETQAYIKGQMAFLAQIAQRKTFAALVSMALAGGQGAASAAKQIQELSGIMNQQDTNRTIVLHHIPRPKQQQNQGGQIQ